MNDRNEPQRSSDDQGSPQEDTTPEASQPPHSNDLAPQRSFATEDVEKGAREAVDEK
jgi:hypothetical protein